ncbi:uracil phosphoribosyltransferase [Metarhizium album ARSEF 1941]|uniref:Uracil phosphoribosyltransferase n=1 Tax=Metarhizium album (strain ARSEF 1941) TaxID=1081103 RepID=A0A0B2WNA4_METAS|nr:uracil phosphoribosyltransferase [Metarhizium album ARSEF 1941]KHN97541.1 uracil phosphoribosyltransferase [Metarhizium album ARSEF 1941]
MNSKHRIGRVDARRAAVQTVLPVPVPVHHLGMYREPSTLDPVEYYNNLPHHVPQSSAENSTASSLVILVDPVIATGGTCAAAIQTLKEWGAKKVLVMSIIGAEDGVKRAAEEWPEGTELWIAGVDAELTPGGMLKPGLGDIGDRLFLTNAKHS